MHFRHTLLRLSRLLPLAAGLIILTTGSRALGGEPSTQEATPSGFTALFNGVDLSGWWGLAA